jgi:AraC-like DNA-binding protein
VSALREQGYPLLEILQRAGLDPAVVQDPDARLPHAAVIRFWEEAVKVTGDASLALRLAARLRPAAFDALGYVFRTSASLGEGLGRLARYHRFVQDALTLVIETGPRGSWIVVRTPSALTSRPLAEFVLAGLAHGIRRETGDHHLDPSEVHFAFARPASVNEYGRFFRAPVRFSRASNALLYPRGTLERPLRGAEPELREVLERRVRDVIARLPKLQSVAEDARAVLGDDLPAGRATAAAVGRRLGVSERTLRRRLRAEGTSLRALLKDVRRTLSERHIRAGVTLTETAFLLGYSEVSAFNRSFKSWTGQTPGAYRREGAEQHGSGKE